MSYKTYSFEVPFSLLVAENLLLMLHLILLSTNISVCFHNHLMACDYKNYIRIGKALYHMLKMEVATYISISCPYTHDLIKYVLYVSFNQ